MFSTWKQRALLGLYVFLILSVPVGAYLASQQQSVKSKANEEVNRKIEGPKLTDTSNTPTTSAQQEIKNLLSASPTPTPSTATATTFGPTLDFSLILEGRPTNNQASSVFVGISAGSTAGSQQNYLLSFTVDLPASGTFTGLSLAGLTAGSQYTAFIKPTAQIATSSGFLMSSSVTNLNSGVALTFLTGDLNEDNVINTADYNIAKAAYGSTASSENWNSLADFNQDGIVNNYDMGYIFKNFSQTGQSGHWISTPLSTSSIPTKPATGGVASPSGYWLWVPQ